MRLVGERVHATDEQVVVAGREGLDDGADGPVLPKQRREDDQRRLRQRGTDTDAVIADQDEVKGTGRAASCGLAAIGRPMRACHPSLRLSPSTSQNVPISSAMSLLVM